jgi:hypothetical protein
MLEKEVADLIGDIKALRTNGKQSLSNLQVTFYGHFG